MKAASVGRRVWVECAVLAGLSALMIALMNELFGRYRPTRSLLRINLATPPLRLGKSLNQEEKAKAEPVRRTLDQATAQVNSPEKANQVAERLEKLAGSATTGEIEQARPA